MNSRQLPPTLPHGQPWPRISIVTPTFNHGAFIEETIVSVLEQNYPNVEHIVIDGGSTDETNSVLERHRDKLAYVVSEPDRGQSHAINKGMSRATGDIVSWLNSDDRLAPGALAAVAMAFHMSGADMVAGICELWRDGEMITRHLTSCDDGPLPLEDLLDLDGCWNAGQFFYQPEVYFTRDLWNRAGGYVEEDWYYCMDYELWLRFANAGARLKVIGRPIARFRSHPAQKTADPKLFQAELPKARDRFLAAHGRLAPVRPAAYEPVRSAHIVFVNDIGFRYGAGIAHHRLAAACEMAGHKVTPLSARNSATATPLSDGDQTLLMEKIHAAAPDFVVVGNLHGVGLTPTFLSAITEQWPTAFVTHDLWLLTGRCTYTGGCDKLLSGCDEACPSPDEYPALRPDQIAPAWAAKRALLRSGTAPLLLANSQWTATQLQRALGLDAGNGPVVAPITLGVGYEFVPLDPQECRQLLGLPQDAFLILLSASALSDPRKGHAHLLKALSLLDAPDVELLLVGIGDDLELPGFRVHRMPFQLEPGMLAKIYAAADVFVGPSLEECLGQVFLEAAACGVPSVGYPVGGVPEALHDGITGVLAREVSPEALTEAIRRVYVDREFRRSASVWGRLAHENERTLECTYHSLHRLLRHSWHGADRFFSVNINLRPLLASERYFPFQERDSFGPRYLWRAINGFGPMEGPYPEWNLSTCQWQESLSSSFVITTALRGSFRILLRVRNLAPQQHVEIRCGDRQLFQGEIPVTPPLKDLTLSFTVMFEATDSLFTCKASESFRSPENRELILLFCGFEVQAESPTASN